ncbi:MAG: hypothetical protein J6D23_00355 [Clostridia bacterium]|nr:hypothetical protein [Clostridia bacterium]
MTEQKKIDNAFKVLDTLCTAIDNRGWSFDCDAQELTINFQVTGEDFPMDFIITIDVDCQLISFFSPLPFKMSNKKRIDGAIAVCAASCGLVDGNFIYNIEDGSIVFKQTSLFINSEIGEDLLQYMIENACSVVDKYNDKFLALSKGFADIDSFIKH